MKNTVGRVRAIPPRGAGQQIRVHLIENQVRSGSEQAEHNCDRLIRQGIWAQVSGKFGYLNNGQKSPGDAPLKGN